MDAKFIQRGDSIDFRPERDVAAGEVVTLSGKLVGIAKLDIKAGELGSLSLTGVFDMPKAQLPHGDAAEWLFVTG